MDQGFPNQHTTHTTVTSNTRVQTNIRYDPSYIRLRPGILKVVEIVLNLLGFICIQVTSYSDSRGEFFSTVSMTGVWFTGILLVFYLFHLIEKFYKIPWLKVELVFCAVITLLYLIAACLTATRANGAYNTAAFFGFCAMVVYGYDAFLKYAALGRGELAQGDRVVSKETTRVSSPAY